MSRSMTPAELQGREAAPTIHAIKHLGPEGNGGMVGQGFMNNLSRRMGPGGFETMAELLLGESRPHIYRNNGKIGTASATDYSEQKNYHKGAKRGFQQIERNIQRKRALEQQRKHNYERMMKTIQNAKKINTRFNALRHRWYRNYKIKEHGKSIIYLLNVIFEHDEWSNETSRHTSREAFELDHAEKIAQTVDSLPTGRGRHYLLVEPIYNQGEIVGEMSEIIFNLVGIELFSERTELIYHEPWPYPHRRQVSGKFRLIELEYIPPSSTFATVSKTAGNVAGSLSSSITDFAARYKKDFENDEVNQSPNTTTTTTKPQMSMKNLYLRGKSLYNQTPERSAKRARRGGRKKNSKTIKARKTRKYRPRKSRKNRR